MAAASELVDDFRQAMLEVWQRDGKTAWPIELNTVSHLFIEDFDKALLEDIDALRQQGLTHSELARLFVIPQRVIRLVMPFVQGLGAMGLSRDERREQVHFLLSLVDELKHGNASNRDGPNLVLSPQDSARVIEASRLSACDEQSSRLVHRLCGVLWAYSETLFFKTHGLVREFHGPYQRPGEDRQHLVRDFICLNPGEVWEESSELRYSTARVVAAYDRLDMSVDIYNHVSIQNDRNYVECLHSYCVECDGRLLAPPEIEQLLRELSEVMGAIHRRVDAMSWQQRAEKYAEIFWFSKKNLRDRLQLDWALPEAVRGKIRSGELKANRGNLGEKELKVLLRLSF